jgi:hypothetical protein
MSDSVDSAPDLDSLIGLAGLGHVAHAMEQGPRKAHDQSRLGIGSLQELRL